MAMCSYAISFTPNFTSSLPPWADKLHELGLHPEWVSMLKHSQLADFSEYNKRVRVLVLLTCKYLHNIPRMLCANVPVWFCWDDPHDFIHDSFIYNLFCPMQQQVTLS
jgi:hypothetical protein